MAPNLDMRWQDQNVFKKDGQWTVDGRPNVNVSVVCNESPANMPNHYYIGLKVTAPVGAATPPHMHGGAAVHATMIRGKMINQMICPHHDPDSQGTGPGIYNVGDSWYEPPGCHHVRSENAGDEEVEFIAMFVVEKKTVDEGGIGALVVIDAAEEEKKGK